MSRKDDLIKDLQELAAKEKAVVDKGCAVPEDPNKVSGDDRKIISLEREQEMRDWARSLGCTEQELRETMQVVGNSVDEVRRFLSIRKS